jgi:hypothetical protein
MTQGIDGRMTTKFDASSLNLPKLAYPAPVAKIVRAYDAKLDHWATIRGQYDDAKQNLAAAIRHDVDAFAAAAIAGEAPPAPTEPAARQAALQIEVVLAQAAADEKRAAQAVIDAMKEHTLDIDVALAKYEGERVEEHSADRQQLIEQAKKTKKSARAVGQAATTIKRLLRSSWAVPSCDAEDLVNLSSGINMPVTRARRAVEKIANHGQPLESDPVIRFE